MLPHQPGMASRTETQPDLVDFLELSAAGPTAVEKHMHALIFQAYCKTLGHFHIGQENLTAKKNVKLQDVKAEEIRSGPKIWLATPTQHNS